MPKRAVSRWVEKGPLAPWMVAYAKWLAGEPGAELSEGREVGYRGRYPTGDERARRCTEFSGRLVHRQFIPLVERRPDFKEYFGKLRSDTQFHAKELARDTIALNFRARQKGLEKALGKKVGEDGTVTYDDNAVDHREIERYTRPFLDHAFPKKEEHAPAVQKFTINLFGASEDQKRLLLKAVTPEEPDEIEYEIIPNEKTEAEDD